MKQRAEPRSGRRLDPEQHIASLRNRNPERSVRGNWMSNYRPVGSPCRWEAGRIADLRPGHGLATAGRLDVPGHPLRARHSDGHGPSRGEHDVRADVPWSEDLDDHGRDAAKPG